MDSGLDMTPLQFLETGLTPDDGEDALIFDTSEDYDDDAHADDTTSERDRYVQEMERLGWDTYPPDASEFDVDQSLYGVRSPAIRRTGHQSFVSRLMDDLADDGESTDETEIESEASVEKTIAPRSIYTVTATEPADFFEEYWQTQEYVAADLRVDTGLNRDSSALTLRMPTGLRMYARARNIQISAHSKACSNKAFILTLFPL